MKTRTQPVRLFAGLPGRFLSAAANIAARARARTAALTLPATAAAVLSAIIFSAPNVFAATDLPVGNSTVASTAQTMFWTGGSGGTVGAPGSGNWNTAANWSVWSDDNSSFVASNSAPITGTSGNRRDMYFGGSGDTPYTATNNISSALTGTMLVYRYWYLDSSASVTNVITGGAIVFSYTTPILYQNGSGDFNISSDYCFSNTLTVKGNGTGTIEFSGRAGGGQNINGGSIVIALEQPTATVRFSSNENSRLNVVTLNSGTLDFTTPRTFENSYYADSKIVLNGGTFLSSNGTTASDTQRRTIQVNGAFTFGGEQDWGTGTMAVNLNNNVAITVNAGGSNGVTIAGVISDGTSGDTLTLAAGSTGTLTLAAQNTYTGDTVVNGGTLAIGIDEAITNASNLVLGSGTLAVGTFTETLGTLTLTANSAITLDEGGSLTFADSTTSEWGSFTLSITGTVAANGIRFGADGNGLTSAQLAAITINGSAVVLDTNGYLLAVAVPEPATITALLGASVLVAGSLLVHRRRRRNVS
ncbi:MAG: autotransporter-associated beta strand repeat-containing protein [Opitutaceae bacterium]|jgi:autotransporter-associated beta strand protein|nr:autotransporter-associated beta strand repeat-containing protein [Opitutaceae bacterium]